MDTLKNWIRRYGEQIPDCQSGGKEWETWIKGDQNIQAFIYKMTKFWGCNI